MMSLTTSAEMIGLLSPNWEIPGDLKMEPGSVKLGKERLLVSLIR